MEQVYHFFLYIISPLPPSLPPSSPSCHQAPPWPTAHHRRDRGSLGERGGTDGGHQGARPFSHAGSQGEEEQGGGGEEGGREGGEGRGLILGSHCSLFNRATRHIANIRAHTHSSLPPSLPPLRMPPWRSTPPAPARTLGRSSEPVPVRSPAPGA